MLCKIEGIVTWAEFVPAYFVLYYSGVLKWRVRPLTKYLFGARVRSAFTSEPSAVFSCSV